MMDALTSLVVWLNAVANALGRILTPIGLVPGWLSTTLIAIATGFAMLLAFKYTSNQRAIKRARRDIRANLLAAKLFRDNIGLGFRSQARVVIGAFRLLILAIVPILAMSVPMILLLAQLGLWYQAAPLPVGAETVVTAKLSGAVDSPLPIVEFESSEAIEVLSGPVQVISQREVCWHVRVRRAGYHRLRYRIGSEAFDKELAVGAGLMRVSPLRPDRRWWDVALNPYEPPFDRDSPVRSIEIEYPERDSWTSGTDYWVYYWFIVSLVAGFCFRGALNVNL